MKAVDIINKYIRFFEERGHKGIPNASLIPENISEGSTTLFTTAGMQPLIPYLLGKKHPLGRRLVNIQRCLRTDDIEEVGDATHHTFYEMLGNWSFGDYWKKEAISWSFEFLTKELNISTEKLAVTIFEGDKEIPKDDESILIWRSLGIPENRIFPRSKKDNWWGPVGLTGPCGPDTEMFVWISEGKPGGEPNENPSWVEVWNDVFMQYYKLPDGSYKILERKNVDTGMGLERITTVLQDKKNSYETDIFFPLYKGLSSEVKLEINDTREKRLRKFLDHSRASIFLINDGILPGKNERESVLRRLIRTANDQLTLILEDYEHTKAFHWWEKSLEHFKKVYSDRYNFEKDILQTIESELKLYGEYTSKETPHVEQLIKDENKYKVYVQSQINKFNMNNVSVDSFLRNHSFTSLASVAAGTIAFQEKSTQGFPLEQTFKIAQQNLGAKFIDTEAEETLQIWQEQHQKVSRVSAAQKFAGGLADHQEKTIMGHTATHLLHQAIRDVLGDKVYQTGSNITVERVRFDFNYDTALTQEQIKQVEEIVNDKIDENLPVHFEMLPLLDAKKIGAIGLFDEKYSDKVKVYFIGSPSSQSSSGQPHKQAYSVEFCGGPHVDFTGKIKRFTIVKEEGLGRGKRRIYARVGE